MAAALQLLASRDPFIRNKWCSDRECRVDSLDAVWRWTLGVVVVVVVAVVVDDGGGDDDDGDPGSDSWEMNCNGLAFNCPSNCS